MITINALKIRTKLGSILDDVSKNGQHYIVERLGKPLAVIVPYQKFDLQNEEKIQREKRMEEAAKTMDRLRQKYGSRYSNEDSAIIVRRMRDERAKHLLDVVEGRQ